MGARAAPDRRRPSPHLLPLILASSSSPTGTGPHLICPRPPSPPPPPVLALTSSAPPKSAKSHRPLIPASSNSWEAACMNTNVESCNYVRAWPPPPTGQLTAVNRTGSEHVVCD